MPGILRYKIDIIAVFTILLTVSLQLCGILFRRSWYLLFPFVLLVRQVTIIQHNHAHLKIFYSRFLNELLGRLCSLSNGVMSEFYELHHVRNHHQLNQLFVGEKQDWSSLYAFKGTRFPDQPVGQIYYVLTFPFIALSHCVIEMARSPSTLIFRRFRITVVLAIPILSWLIWMNAWHFFLFFIVPWTVIGFGLGYDNYGTHHGCKYEDRFDIAIDDLAFPFRFLGYNQGYHLEHHLKLSLNWSLLPSFHETIKTQIPPRNIRHAPAVSLANPHKKLTAS